jgi:hypothetical protein
MTKTKGWLPFSLMLVVGFAVALAASASPAPAARSVFPFLDGDRSFCSDGGPLNVSVFDYPIDFQGFPDHQTAADVYVTWLRSNLYAPEANEALKPLLEEALAPTRNFALPIVSEPGLDVAYHDLDPDGDGILEARLIVERVGVGNYGASISYTCSSVLSIPGDHLSEYWKGVGA